MNQRSHLGVSLEVREIAMLQMAGVGRQFVKAAMAAKFLERDEERALAQNWKDHGDETALHELAAAHMRLVIALAARFRHYGLPLADLIQEGHVGLLEAAARFEPEREVRFSTYATWWIRASIQDYILRNWSIVRGGTSSAQKALFFNLRRLRAKLSQNPTAGGNTSMFATIAMAIGVSPADVELMDTRLSGSDVSLNAPVSESDSAGKVERVDFLVDDKPLPDETVGEQIDSDRRVTWLNEALGVLSERELRIVRERRLAEESATLEALGERLGISKERVRQIENRAMEKLRRALTGMDGTARVQIG
jgi:RNA polymerase sigma-32 factor